MCTQGRRSLGLAACVAALVLSAPAGCSEGTRSDPDDARQSDAGPPERIDSGRIDSGRIDSGRVDSGARGDTGAGPGDSGAPRRDSGARADAGGVMPDAWVGVPTACVSPPQADVSGARVVGNGTPASCTETALDTALADPSVSAIVFDCGPAPHTITVSNQKTITRDLVIDGGDRVTLSGGGTTRILAIDADFRFSTPHLVVQNLRFIDGSTESRSGANTDWGGAAIYRLGGSLEVHHCTFENNVGPVVGQDVAGGAVYSIGEGETIISDSIFRNNRCSSGGAVGFLHADWQIINTVITDNRATGQNGNPGNGGNGGGVYSDGVDQNVVMCGVTIANNSANARGGGLFRVSNNGVGPMTINRSAVLDNTIGDTSASQAGGMYLQGLQLTITNSTVAGNEARSTGGLFIWTDNDDMGAQTLQMTNCTIAGNRAHTGLGAGMSINDGVTGTLLHVTIARNSNDGAASFASALAGGGGLRIVNSLIADQMHTFQYENLSCNSTHMGSGTYQWPRLNNNGNNERECVTGVTFLDPQIGTLGDNGGPTPTIVPAASGLIGALSSGCAPEDQRGQPRSSAGCTPGAVEP